MEKKISFAQFQSVKSVAKAITPILSQRDRIQAQIDALDVEYQEKVDAAAKRIKAAIDEKKADLEAKKDSKTMQIEAIEAGIVQIIGFHVSDLVKRVIEPTGKTDKDGKPIKETKYLPTDIVTYDSTTKQYIITTSDDKESSPTTEEDSSQAGSEGTENIEDDVEIQNEQDGTGEIVDAGTEESVEEPENIPSDEFADAADEKSTDEMPWDL